MVQNSNNGSNGVYRGLLMGASRKYWVGILEQIYNLYGGNEWTWGELLKKCPEIKSSDLRRLNYSNYFVKLKTKQHGASLWKLRNVSVDIVKGIE